MSHLRIAVALSFAAQRIRLTFAGRNSGPCPRRPALAGLRSLALTWILILLAFLASGHAVANAAAETMTAKEPDGPRPAPALQHQLDAADRLLQEKKVEAALSATQRTSSAVGDADAAGRACVLRLEAQCLERLHRPKEAVAAWLAADSAWQRLDAGPERIESLCAAAECPGGVDSAAALRLVDRAIATAFAEKTRPVAAAAALNAGASHALDAAGLDIGERLAHSALAILQDKSPDSREAAISLNALGNVALYRQDLDAARGYHMRALEIRERLVPGSLDVAASLGNLGLIAYSLGELDTARDEIARGLAIQERLAPGSSSVARSYSNLAIVAHDQGDFNFERDELDHALVIAQDLDSNSMLVESILNNLGMAEETRGDLEAAQDYCQRALALDTLLAPGSLSVATTYRNLGNVARDRGDLDAAQDYHLRSLAIEQRQAPGSMRLAMTLDNLGNVEYDRNHLEVAQRYHERARAVAERQAPGSMDLAECLDNLGTVLSARGRFEAAADCHRRALAIEEKVSPGSHSMGLTLGYLGDVDRKRGDLRGARRDYEHALAILEAVSPGSLDHAAELLKLGQVLHQQGDLPGAEHAMARSWAIVRTQRHTVTGDEAGRAYAAYHASYSAELVGVRLAQGRTAAAFQALEEGRAQGLLELLSTAGRRGAREDSGLWFRFESAERKFHAAGRNLADAVEAVAQLESASASGDASRSQGSAPGSSAQHLAQARKEREGALASYTLCRLEQERLLGEVRRSVPGLQPRALSLAEARKALPAGCVFLAWQIGEVHSSLFLIPADPRRSVSAMTLRIGEKKLSRLVDSLRELMNARRSSRGMGELAAAGHGQNGPAVGTLPAMSHALYEALFPPAARREVEAARRVVLCPDGPLWDLPFAALETRAIGTVKWLGLEKPLSYAPSLTVLAMDRQHTADRSRGDRTGVLIVGDPLPARVADPHSAPAVQLASAAKPPASSALRAERLSLLPGRVVPPRLPWSSKEARDIAALYGAQPLIGRAATEAEVRRRLADASIVHLATHGYFNPYLAMASGVLLAPPSGAGAGSASTDDDGALQAWEFGPSMPLVAQLMVLSACETGRGEKVPGEGLVGLTRALQGAGARSVVTSLWKVADRSTAMLMVSFHRNLLQGLAKDEALRRAMAETAAVPAFRTPYYWAPFLLTGDPDKSLALARR